MVVERAPFSLERLERAVDKVRERLERATSILERAGIPYAVAGGNAVALWVTTVDEAAIRNTRDVDILIRRGDLAAVKTALESHGFVYRHTAGIDVFLDGPDAKVRDAVHLIFAGEMVRAHEALPNPGVENSVESGGVRVLSLEALVQIKLTAFRDKDRTHLRDMLEVGLIDETWCDKYPQELADRLKQLIDTPEG
jgi:hypothetical protein